jgi:hypothetical protein
VYGYESIAVHIARIAHRKSAEFIDGSTIKRGPFTGRQRR